MTGNQFINKYLGKNIDTDGYPKEQPYQCVDLIKGFIDEVLEVKPQSIGDAKEYWIKRNQKYIKSNFKAIENTPEFIPQPFDIVVFDTGTCGHIAICSGDGSTHSFWIWQQNAPVRAAKVNLAQSRYTKVMGFLRPLDQEKVLGKNNKPNLKKGDKIKFTSNRKFYKSASTVNPYEIKEVTKLTDASHVIFKSGTEFKIDEINGNWVKITYGKTQGYICYYSEKQDVAFVKKL